MILRINPNLKSKTAKLVVLIAGLACLGIFGLFLNSDNQGGVIKTQEDFIRIQTETPYDAIYQYYKALEATNWDLIQSLTTRALWEYIQTSGFRESWERRIAEDPSLKFELFIVKKQSIDLTEGEGWVMGKADWTSQRTNVPDDNRTIFFQKQGESWVISKVISLPAVEVVDDFYEAINAGNLIKAEQLTTREYWEKLVAAGVIDGIKRDRRGISKGVYVVFLVEDFTQKKDEAWVKGDVSFNPLTPGGREVSVNVHVVKVDGEWKINKIVGHWDLEK